MGVRSAGQKRTAPKRSSGRTTHKNSLAMALCLGVVIVCPVVPQTAASATKSGAKKPDAASVQVLRTSRGAAFRRGPSTGREFAPSTNSDYRRNERLRFEVATDDVGAMTARLLGPAGTPVNVPVVMTIRVDQPRQQSIVVADLTLAPLAPAEYELELTLEERGTKNLVTYRFAVVP